MAINKFVKFVLSRIDILLFISCVIFFLCFPDIDISVTSIFYNNEFYWNNNTIVRAIYLIFAKIHGVYLLLLIGLALYFYKKKNHLKMYQQWYLFTVLILGPGIFVNFALKDNSLGRPRPVHIVDFGGKELYTPPFHYSGVCERNCSFVSGHAAIGFYPLALFWIARRRRWLIIGIGMGVIVGGTRILQGGHFLSDVIFAGWVVYFTSQLCYTLFKKQLSTQ